jgi:CRP-like cAMP-binding protein
MGTGDRVARKIYMRKHSMQFRRWDSRNRDKGDNTQQHVINEVVEDDVLELHGKSKIFLRIICRNKERMLQRAWNKWTNHAGVKHDYAADMRTILLRPLPDDCNRSELEIEVMFKWVTQNANADPTGIAIVLGNCKSKKLVVSALQQLRLECYHPRDGVVYQGNLPRGEDGHFTVLTGECDVVQFQQNSLSLLKLQDLTKRKKWDEVRMLLEQAQSLAIISTPAGFGELNTLTAVKRAATVKAGADGCELLVLPKQNFLECQACQRMDNVNNSIFSNNKNGPLPSEAIDFLRQSGLAHKISANDLVAAAKSVVKRTLSMGEVLFCKGEPVNSMFLVVSGEFALDVSDYRAANGKYQPFINSNVENVHHLGAGSILGDEGILGQSGRFESTAVAVSEIAVCFEAVGFGLTFLAERLGASRYSALAYKDLPRWSESVPFAEQANLYSHFNSLRRSIAQQRPFRGSKVKSFLDDKETARAADFTSPMMLLHRPVLVDQLAEQHRSHQHMAGSLNESSQHSGGGNVPKIGLIQMRNRSKSPQSHANSNAHGQTARNTSRPMASPRRGTTMAGAATTARGGNPNTARNATHPNTARRPGSSGPAGAAAGSGPMPTIPVCESAVAKATINGVTGRVLTATALHHAVELNKTAKKRYQEYFKVSAEVCCFNTVFRRQI